MLEHRVQYVRLLCIRQKHGGVKTSRVWPTCTSQKRTVLRIPRFRLTSASIQDIDPLWVQCRYVNPLAQLQSPAVFSAVACYAQAARVRWPGITKRLRLPERSARHWRQVKHKEADAAGAYLQRICEVTVYVESVKTDKAVVELSIFYT